MSFADVLNRKKSVKSVVCQTDLTWVSSVTPVQTVHSNCVSGGPGSVLTSTQASSGKSAGLDRRPGTVRVRFANGQKIWVSRCWTQFLSRAPDFDPWGWIKVQFWAPAGKLKVAGAWVSATEFRRPVASRPTSNPNGTPKRKGVSDRRARGQNDPVKTYDRFGSLGEDASMEVEVSRTYLPASLSGWASSLTK